MSPSEQGRWRVFLSHTSELRQYPSGGSYIDKAERAVIAAGHVPVDMKDFPSIDEVPAQVCINRVNSCDVYVGIYGTRWGSPVKDRQEVSYTELEFDTATASKDTDRPIERLVFLLDEDADDSGIPYKALIDRKYGDRQEGFLKKVKSAGLTLQKFANPDQLSQLLERSLKELTAGSGHSPSPPSYTSAELDRWVEQRGPVLERAFLDTNSVQDRRVHVPLEVQFTPAGGGASEPMLLQPEQLEGMLGEAGSAGLLISGDGGTGKTSLAFRIARWLMEGRPGGIKRLPFLIETALQDGESVLDRAFDWLKGHIELETDPDPALVEALLRHKRLIPIVDHVSELPLDARQRLVENLPTGLVIATSRSTADSYKERPLSRIQPCRIPDVESLLRFFLDYQQQKRQEGELQADELLTEEELIPSLQQLKRIVGDKPITALLARMYIDDVIAKRKQGVFAGSVPELMLSYVERVDTPSDERMRQRSGLEINRAMVQRALKVLALASHRIEERGRPVFKPMEFRRSLALEALAASEGMGIERRTQREALLGYLIELNLLKTPDADKDWLRLPLDPLADYLAAMLQQEHLEDGAGSKPENWECFLGELEKRPLEERKRMRGFLLALRDCCSEQATKEDRVLVMPANAPDRLGRLGFLDPEEERYRQAAQRARKWMWELGVPVASERRDAISKLAAMATSRAEALERRAVCEVASKRLVLMLRDGNLPEQERCEAALVLGMVGGEASTAALGQTIAGEGVVAVRRAAAEALGLWAAGTRATVGLRRKAVEALKAQLGSTAVNVMVWQESDWDQVDHRLPLLQGASRGLQLAMGRDLPLLGAGPGLNVPMLSIMTLQEGEGQRVRTDVLKPAVWKLPLPGGEKLELVRVPGGEFTIGSTGSDPGKKESYSWTPESKALDREPLRTLVLESFAMVRYPISQAQWAAVAGMDEGLPRSPGSFKTDELWESYAQPGCLPVDSVSWDICVKWLALLNSWLELYWRREGLSGMPPQLRLPGEGEWEVACRAGSVKPFHFGETLDPAWANYDHSVAYKVGRKVNSYPQRPLPIGSRGLVNRWGLAEMHGQLFEWCGDRWHPSPLGGRQDGRPWEEIDTSPEAAPRASHRLLRGGSWNHDPHLCRAAFRASGLPSNNFNYYGIRPCCSLPQ